ncbi:Acryloyl-coenzyme A reductase [Candidatus Lokiarchaeum ossiferum]|uniref:Acryloyl-coenzyme A reductase n=1 Tax=Candidatus Lokiarchaeum ossiferum TaxID=2951803 RepID=A0ABY6HYR1_9ARCH|nr:Acryloyl-coenzyme A reductase [Candidatus Lokiarchaeum sp. B-35]
MKAIVRTKYGAPEVLKLEEIEKPIIKENEILIKVHATSVTPMDYRVRSGKVPLWPISKILIGFWKPKQKILGTEVSGEVVEIGNAVKKFKIGDKVFGTGENVYAEYFIATEKNKLELMPDSMSFEQGASVYFGFISAIHFLKRIANIQRGQRILINGASGGVGVFAVQLANQFGAEVTGVCSSKNVDLVRSLGAKRVIDYTKADFTKEKNQKYDLIFDIVGKSSFSKCRKLMTKNGIYLNIIPSFKLFIQMLWTSKLGKKKVITGIAEAGENLTLLKDLVESNKLQIIIDKVYPLEKVADAHAYAEKGHKVGSVVITLDHL